MNDKIEKIQDEMRARRDFNCIELNNNKKILDKVFEKENELLIEFNHILNSLKNDQ